MKVFISNNGIKHNTDVYFDDSISAFNAALNISYGMSCPTTFKYRSDVIGLYSELRKYKNKLTSLQNSLDRIQKSYDNFNDTYIQKTKRLVDVDVHEKLPVQSINGILD